MLDLRLAATALAMLVAMVSVAIAEPAKDQPQETAQASAETRPIRVILPAPWEPSKGQGEAAIRSSR